MVGKDLAILVAKAVEIAARTHMNASPSEEQLTQVLEPLLMKALPKVLSQEMSHLQPIIRQSVSEIANPLIKERIDQFVREEINAVRTALSDIVREQLGSLEGLIKEEIQQAATKHSLEKVDALILATAREQVEKAVRRLVPDLAQEQIKAEITRLTKAA
jgi:Arc/MetJ family transcription regulator